MARTPRILTFALLLLLAAAGTAELAGHLPATRRFVCARATRALEARFDAASIDACRRVSLLRRSVYMEGVTASLDGVEASAERARVRLDRRVWAQGLTVRTQVGSRPVQVSGLDARLSPSASGGWSLQVTGEPQLCLDDRCQSWGAMQARLLASADAVTVEQAELALAGRTLRVSGDAAAERARVDLEMTGVGTAHVDVAGRDVVSVDAVANVESYAQLLDVVDPQLAAVMDLELDGPFSVRLSAAGPPGEPEGWNLKGQIDLEPLREAARRSGAGRALTQPFAFVPTVSETAPEIQLDPALDTFVPLDEIPEHVIKSVLYAEDAAFPTHEGLDLAEIAVAMKENLEAGSIERGASTITQQLAKNLWLTPERTWSRKLSEALAAIALEAVLDKDRILEIYLNSIQWGPDFYGVHAASRHYFGVSPAELTPKQAAFLASVIPSPERYHRYCQEGMLTEYWEQRVMQIVELLYERDVIGPWDYEVAAETMLEFAPPVAPPLSEPETVSIR